MLQFRLLLLELFLKVLPEGLHLSLVRFFGENEEPPLGHASIFAAGDILFRVEGRVGDKVRHLISVKLLLKLLYRLLKRFLSLLLPLSASIQIGNEVLFTLIILATTWINSGALRHS